MMLPVIRGVHGRPPAADVTVVADAGMISEANQKAIEAGGLSFHSGGEGPRQSLTLVGQ